VAEMADGRDGRWQMADGRWQMANSRDIRWQMADGREPHSVIKDPFPFLPFFSDMIDTVISFRFFQRVG